MFNNILEPQYLFLKNIFKGKINQLSSDENNKLFGIFSSLKNQNEVNNIIHEQFTLNAAEYDKLYFNIEHSRKLILNALTKVNFNLYRNYLNILDIGSGSGQSVIPLLELFSTANIIASDPSLELLYILKNHLAKLNVPNKPIILQLNAKTFNFTENTFDLIVGWAILHRLFSPQDTLKCCSDILKKDGYAIFFDPFENGNSILCCIYEVILKDNRSQNLDPIIYNFFKRFIADIRSRKGRDKSDPLFLRLDNKWLFTKKYFEEYVEKYNFSKCIIYSLHDSNNQFENQTKTLLKFGINFIEDSLPQWAWDIIKSYDQIFSEDMKQDLLIEGCTILQK